MGRVLLALLLYATMEVGFASGQVTDTLIHVPADYDTFLPPPVGGSYADGVYGTTITRMSNAAVTRDDAADDGRMLQFINTEFSTMTPFNVDNSRILAMHFSYFGLYNGTGGFIKNLPFAVTASSEPRWSHTNPNLLYFIPFNSNQLKQLDVSTNVISVVHTFLEYTSIRGEGESDISFDGNHFVFAGNNRFVFVYEISSDTMGTALDAGSTQFDNLYITPDNNVLITWIPTGTARFKGVEMFDRNMNFLRQVTRAGGHMDVTRDVNGDEVLLWVNSNDPTPPPNCPNGIVKVRLANAAHTCLLTLDISLAVHISGTENREWFFMETYAPSDPSPGTSAWKLYTNEILQVKLDGTQVRRLAHHRSRQRGMTFQWQPRAAASRDGSRVIYSSNYNLQTILGPGMGYGTEYGDTYLITFVPSAVSVTPASGTGSSQTFSYVFFDNNGFGDIGTTSMVIQSANGSSACYMYRSGNQLSLLNDTFSAYLGPLTLGMAGTVQNSQCIVDGAGSSLTGSVNNLTVNVALTFKPGFAGMKNNFMIATDNAGLSSGWQSPGTWTVPALTPPVAPDAVSVAPASGTGASQTFSYIFSDANGFGDIASTSMVIQTVNGSSACYMYRSGNQLSLLNDTFSAYLGPLTLGAAGTVQNSQCIVDAAGSSVMGSGNNLTVNVALTFKPAFAGMKNNFMTATDNGGLSSSWQSRGTWTVPAPVPPTAPEAVSVAPASGTGTSQTFSYIFSDTNGFGDIASTSMVIQTVNGSSACYMYWSGNQLSLLNDNFSAYLGPLTLGISGTVQNSQCIVDSAGSSVMGSGNNLTVNVALTFRPAFAGMKNNFMTATDNEGLTSGWQSRGAWTVPAPVPPTAPEAVSVAPASGTGSSQTFSYVFSDANGFGDIGSTSMVIQTVNGSSACYMYRSGNQLWLLNDAFSAYLGPLTLGSAGTVQNSQCIVDGAGSSVMASGNNLTVNVALTLKPAFAGMKNNFMIATDNGGLTSGWQSRGTWTVP